MNITLWTKRDQKSIYTDNQKLRRRNLKIQTVPIHITHIIREINIQYTILIKTLPIRKIRKHNLRQIIHRIYHQLKCLRIWQKSIMNRYRYLCNPMPVLNRLYNQYLILNTHTYIQSTALYCKR